MGDSAVDVTLDMRLDWRPDGSVATQVIMSSSGLHWDVSAPSHRASLRAAASGTDAEVRAALVACPAVGAAGGRAWDDAVHQDELHGPHVSGYVPVRPRWRSCLAALP